MYRPIFIALAALAAGAAAAQQTERPNPVDPQAKTPATEYRSAFSGYQAFTEEKVAPWRDSNEAVKPRSTQEGRGMQEPAQPPRQSEQPPSKPGVMEHGGHR